MTSTESNESLFANLHTVVSGGAGALGSAVTARILAAGGFCHVPILDEAELKHFPFASHERVRIERHVDLSQEAAVQGFFEAVAAYAASHGGRLWASIHIAGGFHYAALAETKLIDFRKMLDTNAVTCFLCCREAARHMCGVPGGGDVPQAAASVASGRGGRIVNVAARPALEPRQGANMSAYTASKAAVAALTEALGEELAPSGVLVNAVAPSIMDTPANRRSMPDADFATWPTTDEVAATMVFLASPANAVTRGGVVPVYGRA